MSYGVSGYAVSGYGTSGAAEPPLNLVIDLQIDVTDASFALSIALQIDVSEPIALSAILAIDVRPVGAYAAPTGWRALVLLNGADISSRVSGEIVIDVEEGAARIAELGYVLTAGTFNPQALVGQAVVIEFVPLSSAGAELAHWRLFTGRVDVPSWDIASGTMRLRCADGLQQSIAAMSRAEIDALTPGARWHAGVFDDAADNWTYLADRMETVAASVDMTPLGQARFTPWAAKATADLEYTVGGIIDGSASMDLAERSSLRNAIDVAFAYRYPRLKRRRIVSGYAYPFALDQILINGYDIPTRDMIMAALGGTGWEVAGDVGWVPVPPGPLDVDLGGGTTGVWAVAPDVVPHLAFGYTAALERRYRQTVEESYAITVRNQRSIAAVGLIGEQRTAGMEVEFDSSGWEQSLPGSADGTDYAPLEPEPKPPALSLQGESHIDMTDIAGQARTDAQTAMETAIAAAQVAVIASHRRNRASVAVPLDARLDVDRTVRFSTSWLTAKGKCARVRHRMNLLAGEAVSEIELAISALIGTGAQPAQSAVSAPSAPASPVPTGTLAISQNTWVGSTTTSVAIDPEWVGYYTNVDTGSPIYSPTAPVYDTKFTVQTPEIPAADRDPLQIGTARLYEVEVPIDELTMVA